MSPFDRLRTGLSNHEEGLRPFDKLRGARLRPNGIVFRHPPRQFGTRQCGQPPFSGFILIMSHRVWLAGARRAGRRSCDVDIVGHVFLFVKVGEFQGSDGFGEYMFDTGLLSRVSFVSPLHGTVFLNRGMGPCAPLRFSKADPCKGKPHSSARGLL